MSARSSRARVSHERWLVSYADFITLLFAFFVVLYAFGKADQKKQTQVSVAIDSAFQSLSVVPEFESRSNGPGLRLATAPTRIDAEQSVSPAKVHADLERMRRDLLGRLSMQISRGTISVQLGRNGLVISLREAGFFDSGLAIHRPETAATLHQIAEALRGTPYDVRVEGHTDNIPIHNTEFDSNWELSSLRATHIARMLLEMHAVSPEQLSAAGYSAYRPVAGNQTAEGRARNRRVDLVVMPRAVLDLPEDKSGWRRITDQ
jgi:chemotaxis protein MotB